MLLAIFLTPLTKISGSVAAYELKVTQVVLQKYIKKLHI